MVITKELSVDGFLWMPASALQLINAGKYTLYQVSSDTLPHLSYLLRTGMSDFTCLSYNGETIDVSEVETANDLVLHNKIVFSGVDSPLVALNAGF